MAKQPKQSARPSVFRKGNIPQRGDQQEKHESPFLQIKPNGRADIVLAVGHEDMMHFSQHSIWLKTGSSPRFPCIKSFAACPGCQYNATQGSTDKPKLTVYMPIYLVEKDQAGKDTGVLTPKAYSFGVQVANQIAALADVQELKGLRLRVTRNGEGLNTKWTIVPMGPYAGNLPTDPFPIDIESLAVPADRDGILAMMANAGIDVSPFASYEELQALGYSGGSEEIEEVEEIDDVDATAPVGDDWEQA